MKCFQKHIYIYIRQIDHINSRVEKESYLVMNFNPKLVIIIIKTGGVK